MKILLINPPDAQIAKYAGPNQIVHTEHLYGPPMGLLYLKSFVKQQTDFPIMLWNAQAPSAPGEKELRKIMDEFNPDLVGITVNTFRWYYALVCAKWVKAISPRAHLVLGGVHVTVYPEETLAQPEVDAIVIGEGEHTFLELANRLANSQPLEGLEGLWFKKDGQIIRNPLRPVEKDLDRFPFPDRSDLSMTSHRVSINRFSPAAVILTSRGCPFHCTFCCSVDKHYRKRSAQNIVQEMLACRELGYKAIDFYDEMFNLQKETVMALCDEIIRQKVNLPWSCRCRVDPVDEEMIARMVEAGCERINLAAESAHQKILDDCKKHITVEQSRRAFAIARKYKLSILGYFMFGFPGETREQALETIRFALELAPDFVNFHSLMPQPGSEIYEQALKSPTFYGDYVREFAKNPTPEFAFRSWETTMTEAEQYRLVRRAFIRFYLRPRYLLNSFKNLYSLEDFFAKARMGLKVLTETR